MTVEMISLSISTKVRDLAGIELATPGSAARLAFVARHITDCATQHGEHSYLLIWYMYTCSYSPDQCDRTEHIY